MDKDKELVKSEELNSEEVNSNSQEQLKSEDSDSVPVKSFADLKKTKRQAPPRKSREERGLPPEEEQKEVKSMTLMEHLAELRTRLVRSFIAIGLAFIVCYTFAEPLFAELCKPLVNSLPEGSKLIFTALPEAFFVYLQVGLFAAIFVASPFLFYQIWGFIAPGLYDEEKKYVIPMALISAIFFISGASFCYFVVFPYAFTFFVGFASEEIAAMPSLKEYLGFAMKLLIAFGLIFEMPLFTFFLARMGIITATLMRKVRKYAVLCIFIIAAILTPPDVISQLLMAFPMMLLYELSIFVAVAFGKKKKEVVENEKTEDETTKAKDEKIKSEDKEIKNENKESKPTVDMSEADRFEVDSSDEDRFEKDELVEEKDNLEKSEEHQSDDATSDNEQVISQNLNDVSQGVKA